MAFSNAVERGAASDSQVVAQNSIILLLRYLSIWGVNMLLVLFLPRLLGVQGLGQLQFAISFASLFAVGVGLGMRQFLVKEVARDHSQLRNYLGTALGLRLLLAAVVFGIIVAITELSGHSSTARQVVYFAALWMVITSFAHLMSTFLFGFESMGKASVGEVANKVLVAAVGIGLLVQGAGVATYAAVLVAGALVEFLIGAGFVSRLTQFRINFHLPRMKAIIVGGAPFLLMSFLLNVYAHVDVVMLRFMTVEEVVGWHAAAFQIYRAVEFLPVVLTTALLPTLARMYQARTPETAMVAAQSIGVVLLVMAPIGLGLSLIAAELISFLPYPETFRNTVPVLTILALTSPVTALLTLLGTIAAAVDRQMTWAVAMLGTVLFNLVLNVFAIPYFQEAYGNGAIGAAAATITSESLMVLIGLWIIPKNMFNRLLGMMAVRIAVSAGGMASAVLLVGNLGYGLPHMVLAGALVYSALAFLTRAVSPEDLAFLRSTVMKRVSGRGRGTNREEETLS